MGHHSEGPTQAHLAKQDAKTVDPSKLTALTPEVVRSLQYSSNKSMGKIDQTESEQLSDDRLTAESLCSVQKCAIFESVLFVSLRTLKDFRLYNGVSPEAIAFGIF